LGVIIFPAFERYCLTQPCYLHMLDLKETVMSESLMRLTVSNPTLIKLRKIYTHFSQLPTPNSAKNSH
jgi:hypothetical protein